MILIDKSKKIHDLALIYAFVNYMEAKKNNSEIFAIERQKYGIAYETDFIHSHYMDAFCEYSNYTDEMFDVDKYLEK